MRRASFVTVLFFALAPLLVGCGDDETTEPEVTYDLTFTGDASFQGAHGGQAIHVAVVEQGSGDVVAEDQGTVSADADPAFAFTFAGVLLAGTSYDLDYWIDSNFMGGTEGTCDDFDDDHQWRIAITSVSADVTIADEHRPGDSVEPVCSSFE